MADPVDTTVILRYLAEDPDKADAVFRGVFPFFAKLERGSAGRCYRPWCFSNPYSC